MPERILFVLKYRQGSDTKPIQSYGNYFSSGLYWSAKFVVDMLNRRGIETKLVQVVDNNDIDREVFEYKPTTVIIEALWVVPSKFQILKQLHPGVKWIVRLHSNIPFLAHEGVAFSWLQGYADAGVVVAANSLRAFEDLSGFLDPDSVLYLPNYYPRLCSDPRIYEKDEIVRIGCYGAIRPLKNQLLQALAAVRFANSESKILHFHINGGRVETGGLPVLLNIRSLFKKGPHRLFEDAWVPRHKFLERLKYLDLGMQVSLSETFCIIAADMVDVGLPLVTSGEVEWASRFSKVGATDGRSIESAIKKALTSSHHNVKMNRVGLESFDRHSESEWLRVFK